MDDIQVHAARSNLLLALSIAPGPQVSTGQLVDSII
jgi:hypothetical protein